MDPRAKDCKDLDGSHPDMKNSDPPDRSRHSAKPTAKKRVKLSPEMHRFIQHMGGYFESSGVPPIGGRILGLLMVAHEPLSAEEIAAALNVSRASVSTNFRMLSAAGLAERYTNHADRTTYYVFPDTAWEQAMVLNVRRAQNFKRIVQEGLAAMPGKDAARSHLVRGSEYADLVLEFFQRAIEEWRGRETRSGRRE